MTLLKLGERVRVKSSYLEDCPTELVEELQRSSFIGQVGTIIHVHEEHDAYDVKMDERQSWLQANRYNDGTFAEQLDRQWLEVV